MERYICVHGHFYQPPRENPSLEAVEVQDSAYPYHDWNERITAECYAPNGASRVLNGEGRIVKIVNNYARMSFNFGPTLLTWLEKEAPEVYQSILTAEKESQQTFSGHGSALAQAYNHMILPLSNVHDKRTQVVWGIEDFRFRFGRPPEGMWLPETAVDLETLDILAEQGIRFTLLAQHQASRVRRIGERSWHDVSGGRIDPARGYELRLHSGRKITLFFYDGPVSRAVAFEGLLDRGENLAGRLDGAFSASRSWPQLVHIATDGESYGHHHRHGDMALAYALHHIESNNLARLTNYGEYLEKYPPTHEVEIIESTSWSCAHGIERWRSDCGCNSGGYPGWNQSWRGPLREAFDWLRDDLAVRCEKRAQRLLKDLWAARDAYISVILDRSPESVERFLRLYATRGLSETEKVEVLKLMEIQRHAMLMYTSCGWFFDDISGIETVQVIQYAGRALQLTQEIFGESPTARFLELLERAKSNVPEHRDGHHIYKKWVQPALIDLRRVGAHYATSSLFEDYGEQTRIFCYTVEQGDYRLLPSGKVRLALGKAKITSEITHESKLVNFGVLHLGDHNLSGGVQEFASDEAYETLTKTVNEVIALADLTELVRVIDRHFGSNGFSLKLLFRDEQRKILSTILDSTMGDAEAVYRQVYEHQAPMMGFLMDVNAQLPKSWLSTAESVINNALRRSLADDNLDVKSITALLEEAKRWRIVIDGAGLGYVFHQTLNRMAERLCVNPGDIVFLRQLEEAVNLARTLPFKVDLWKVQNIYYSMLQEIPSMFQRETHKSSEDAQVWLGHFVATGEKLGVEVSDMKENRIKRVAAVEAMAKEIAERRRIPNATYRLQFNGDFTFRDAQMLLPYLHELGVSDCYASPLFKASSDSSHGYDVCDHGCLNPAIGSEENLDAFSTDLRAHQMGLILDVVPNHMAVNDASNKWWMDVLENGPSSVYASHFDIEWRPVKPELQNKVVLPILEDQYGKVLESGKFRLVYEDGAFFVYYYGLKLPVAPRTYSRILSHQLGTLVQALGETDEYVRELRSILTALSYLPPRTELVAEKLLERNREKEVIKRRIAALYQACAYVRAAIDMAVQTFIGTVGSPRSFDLMDQLLEEQAYRPAYWRVAAEEINYRRFFDVNELAAIRVELPEVFEATHKLVFRLLADGKATGLRIDHPDGLWNPQEYFRSLQASYLLQEVRNRLGAEDHAGDLESPMLNWLSAQMASFRPLYVVAEKVLSEGESLPTDWAIDGTTGYDFLNLVNGVLVDGSNHKVFDRIYSRFIGTDVSFPNLANATKKMIMLVSLASEINAISHQMERIAEKNRLYRDFTLNSLTFAIREVIAALSVYRTYITGPQSVGEQDCAYIEAAVTEAKKRNPRTAVSIFDFVGDTLLLRNLHEFPEKDRQSLIHLVMKFQQITGPTMAKGVEDTAFYAYNRLVSLNEVGGQPGKFGTPVAEFHRLNTERYRRWPHSMLATSTHDTKRSEDVRARLNVLSEIPDEWQAVLTRWSRLNASKKTPMNGDLAPDRNDEYLLYQTLLGTWPDGPSTLEEFAKYRERIAAYMQKATKEAKVHTSWVNANENYDSAVHDFVDRLLPDNSDDLFLKDLVAFGRRVAYFGRYNALSQVLLKLTAPGVPDIYQGNELWDYSLVDPDNRRCVDYPHRRTLLGELKARAEAEGCELMGLARELVDTGSDGRIKLYLTYRTLNFRREHAQLFSDGSYVPLHVRGNRRDHVCAFARILQHEAALVVVPRLVVRLAGTTERPPLGPDVWRDTWLSLPKDRVGQRYRNIYTEEVVSVHQRGGSAGLALSAVCAHFPVALLERISEGEL